MELPEERKVAALRALHKASHVEPEPTVLREGNVVIRTRRPTFWKGGAKEPKTYGEALDLFLGLAQAEYEAQLERDAKEKLPDLTQMGKELTAARTAMGNAERAYERDKTPENWAAFVKKQEARKELEGQYIIAKQRHTLGVTARERAFRPVLRWLQDALRDFDLYLGDE